MGNTHLELIPKVMAGQSTFFFSEDRDSNSTSYERILEFMIFATIRANPRIRHPQLLTLLSTFNVSQNRAERSLRMCSAPSAAIPGDERQRLIFVDNRDQSRCYTFNKNVDWPSFVQAYSKSADVSLDGFIPPLYRPVSATKES